MIFKHSGNLLVEEEKFIAYHKIAKAFSGTGSRTFIEISSHPDVIFVFIPLRVYIISSVFVGAKENLLLLKY